MHDDVGLRGRDDCACGLLVQQIGWQPANVPVGNRRVARHRNDGRSTFRQRAGNLPADESARTGDQDPHGYEQSG
jgi:hypothetical protein